MIRKYRKKPVVVEAVKFTERNLDECIKFIESKNIVACASGDYILIQLYDGRAQVNVDDYIAKDQRGRISVITEYEFEQTYEVIEAAEAAKASGT